MDEAHAREDTYSRFVSCGCGGMIDGDRVRRRAHQIDQTGADLNDRGDKGCFSTDKSDLEARRHLPFGPDRVSV